MRFELGRPCGRVEATKLPTAMGRAAQLGNKGGQERHRGRVMKHAHEASAKHIEATVAKKACSVPIAVVALQTLIVEDK